MKAPLIRNELSLRMTVSVVAIALITVPITFVAAVTDATGVTNVSLHGVQVVVAGVGIAGVDIGVAGVDAAGIGVPGIGITGGGIADACITSVVGISSVDVGAAGVITVTAITVLMVAKDISIVLVTGSKQVFVIWKVMFYQWMGIQGLFFSYR